MEITYQRKHDKSIMVISGEDRHLGYEEKMALKNEITGLLPFYTMKTDGIKQFYYDITGKESLRDYFDREGISKSGLKDVIVRLNTSCERLSKYLISNNRILITPETVFIDKTNRALFLCLYPGQESGLGFKAIMEYVLTQVDHRDRDLTLLCYELYEMTVADECSLMQLAEHIGIEEVAEPEVELIDLRTEEVSFEEEEELGLKERIQAFFQSGRFKGIRKSRDEEVRSLDLEVLDVPCIEGETVILSGEPGKEAGKLIYDGPLNEDNFVIEKDSFRIGSDALKNDGVVKSKTVSRTHAAITREGNRYFIADMNSTNGTTVNDEPLMYSQKLQLHSMDRIKFADVAYVFM